MAEALCCPRLYPHYGPFKCRANYRGVEGTASERIRNHTPGRELRGNVIATCALVGGKVCILYSLGWEDGQVVVDWVFFSSALGSVTR